MARSLGSFLFACIILIAGSPAARGFTLIGIAPAPGSYYSFPLINTTDQFGGNGAVAASQLGYINMVDPMGFPVDLKEFYRWNYPYLTYSFDASFVQFFGAAGMTAVHEAMGTLNDFFSNQTYHGVSSLNLYQEYDGLFKTWKFNPSASAVSVTDLQSLVLGLMVNHLGLGNPYKGCFIIQDILNLNYTASAAPTPGSLTGNFQIAMRNFDPYTYNPTELINGVPHSYTIASDHPFNPLGGTAGNDIIPSVFDAVEYYVSSPNGFSAVAAIRDAFNYGGLPWGLLPWSPPNPTVFRTPGTFFRDEPTDSRFNQRRHALTFDDAGGLKYIYRTNNLAVETLDASVVDLITPANMNPVQGAIALPSSTTAVPGRRTLATFNMGLVTPATPTSSGVRNQANQIVTTALRGGIDSIQFLYTPYDSLLGQNYRPLTIEWNDVFLTNALPTDVPAANPPYFSQRVARRMAVPDITFSAMDLGAIPGGVSLPIIEMPDTNGWVNNARINTQVPMTPPPVPPTAVRNGLGPGQIALPANTNLTFIFTKRSPQYAVQYVGGAGSQATPANMQPLFAWGWITNTGPSDYVLFPYSDTTGQSGIIARSGTPPEIISILIDPGASGPNIINRTTDRILIYGNRLDTVVEIDILSGGAAIPEAKIAAAPYIISDQLIVLPAGLLNNFTEGTGRRFQLTNSAGQTVHDALFNINAGVTPSIFSSTSDGLGWNIQTNLIITGSGFITAGVPVDRMQIYDATGTLLGRLQFDAQVTVSDKEIVIPANYFGAAVYETGSAAASMSVGTSSITTTDHFLRQISVGRSVSSSYSPLRNIVQAYTAVGVGGSRGDPLPQSLLPTISEVFIGAIGTTNWSRGGTNVLTVRGANLHLAQSIEFIDGDGRLIQVIDQTVNTGAPPDSVTLRDGVQPTALRTGVTIVPSSVVLPGAGVDSFDVQIDPIPSGWGLVGMFDSASGNNTNTLRRAVVRTPFGTAIAPVSRTIVITP